MTSKISCKQILHQNTVKKKICFTCLILLFILHKHIFFASYSLILKKKKYIYSQLIPEKHRLHHGTEMHITKQKQNEWNGDDRTNTPELRPGRSPILSQIIAHFAAERQHTTGQWFLRTAKGRQDCRSPTAKTGECHPHNNIWILRKTHYAYKRIYIGSLITIKSPKQTTIQQTAERFLQSCLKTPSAKCYVKCRLEYFFHKMD